MLRGLVVPSQGISRSKMEHHKPISSWPLCPPCRLLSFLFVNGHFILKGLSGLKSQNPLPDPAGAGVPFLAHALLFERMHAGSLLAPGMLSQGSRIELTPMRRGRCSTDANLCEESCPLPRTLHRPLTRRLSNQIFVFVRAINVGR